MRLMCLGGAPAESLWVFTHIRASDIAEAEQTNQGKELLRTAY